MPLIDLGRGEPDGVTDFIGLEGAYRPQRPTGEDQVVGAGAAVEAADLADNLDFYRQFFPHFPVQGNQGIGFMRIEPAAGERPLPK